MNYELSDIEWKLSADQLEKCFLFFHDIQCFKRNNDQVGKMKKSNLKIKVAIYKVLTNDYKKFFLRERFRIRASILNHQIKDSPEKFTRYLQTNYEGLLKLEKAYLVDKPGNIDFSSTNFRNNYKKISKIRIMYDLQKLFTKPLSEFIKQGFISDVILPDVSCLRQRSSRKHFTRYNTNPKLKWRGPVNKLVTIFYELSNSELFEGKPILEGTSAEISDFILNNFIDNGGNKLSNDTVRTILQPGRADKRSPDHKKYKIPS